MSVAKQRVSEPVWHKSSYSGANATECVETAFANPGVLIRDSKCPSRRQIAVSAAAWAHFIAGPLQMNCV